MITTSLLTASASESDASSYATASIAPSANKLILAVTAGGPNGVTANTPTLTGASMTWTQVATQLFDSGNQRQITVFRALSSSPGSGALTFDYAGQTQVRCFWSVLEYSGTVITGTNGADAIVQSATNANSGTNTGITATLGAFASPRNATYGAVLRTGNTAIAVGSGFTENTNINGTDSGMLGVELRPDNDTSVDFTWASVSAFAAIIGLELKASGGMLPLLGVGS